MTDERPDPFERALRDALRERSDALDGETRSRLNRARQRALDELESVRRRPSWLAAGWQPALGAAAVGVLAIALWVGRVPPPSVDEASGDPALEMELLLGDDDLELIDEMDFYAWVESHDTPGPAGDLTG